MDCRGEEAAARGEAPGGLLWRVMRERVAAGDIPHLTPACQASASGHLASRRARPAAHRRRLLGFPVQALLWLALSPAASSHAQVPGAGLATPSLDRFSGTVSLGFDSFSERYSIEEADTLDFFNELRTAVGLNYHQQWSPAASFETSDLISVSNEMLRNIWNVGLDLTGSDGDRLGLASELTTRRFYREAEDEELFLSSDYTQELARLLFRRRLSPVLLLDLRDRFELVDFRAENQYEYDYWRNETESSLRISPNFDTSLEFAYAFSYRSVPDSSAIDYREHELRVDWWQHYGFRTDLEVRAEVEERSYIDEAARPGYIGVDTEVQLGVWATDRVDLRLREELEVIDYDAASQVYFSTVLNRIGVEAAFRVTPALEIGIEPRYALLRADDESGEDFDELSLVLSGDWFRLSRLWLDASFEFGHRDYLDSVGIYSDYWLARSNLYATIELGSRTAWNLFLSYEPERHDLDRDDATTALVSTDLTLHF